MTELVNPEAEGPIERERKYILSARSHDRLCTYLSGRHTLDRVDQRNWYFDDPSGVISASRSSLRIRQESGNERATRIEVTFKGPSKEGVGGAIVRTEIDFDLSGKLNWLGDGTSDPDRRLFDSPALAEVKRFLIGQFEKQGRPLKDIAGRIEIRLVAKMENVRLKAALPNGLVLEVDQFSTERGSYYELEVEFDESQSEVCNACVGEIFEATGIPLVCDAAYPSKTVMTLMDAGVLSPEECAEWNETRKHVEQLVQATRASRLPSER